MLQRMNITISKELYDKIREVAFKEDISMSSLIQTALITHFEQLKTPKEDKSAIREVKDLESKENDDHNTHVQIHNDVYTQLCEVGNFSQDVRNSCGEKGLFEFGVPGEGFIQYRNQKDIVILCKKHFDEMEGLISTPV